MKSRLFWKILLGFWLTFVAIGQAVWLLFAVTRTQPPQPPDDWLAQRVAPLVLAASRAALAEGGPAGFESERNRLSVLDRWRVEIEPAGVPPQPRRDGLSAAVTADGLAPDGRSYRLFYHYRPRPPVQPALLLNTPPEFLLLGGVGGLVFSALLAWYLVAPIQRLRRGFDQLARGNLQTRLGPSIRGRRDEIADLACDFDLMASRLEDLVSARDRLLHDVSHELRSPLSRLQLAIALARSNSSRLPTSLDRIEREAKRLDGMVNELLTLARVEDGLTESEEYFDLAGVVESVISDARFEARSEGVEIVAAIPGESEQHETASVRGSAELIRRAVENVVRNALRYSRAGQQVSLALVFDAGANAFTLNIRDQGPGVPESALDTLFDPFVRADDRNAGFGLGLSIAKRSVTAHGGAITARNGPGGGLEVKIVLPAANNSILVRRSSESTETAGPQFPR